MPNYLSRPFSFHSHRQFTGIATLGAVMFLSACASRYEYRPYDPVVEERLKALELALQEQDSPVTSPAPEPVAAKPEPVVAQAVAEQSAEERLARIESQLANINLSLLQVIMAAPLTEENLFLEKEPVAVPSAPPAPEPVVAPAGEPPVIVESEIDESVDTVPVLLTTASGDYEFDGWSGAEKKYGEKVRKQFDGETTKITDFEANRTDLVGKELERRRYLGPTGEIINLDDWRDEKNVLLIFHRGFAGQVCVTCSVYTISLIKAAQQFEEKDTQVFLIYPGDSRSIPAFLEAVKNVDSTVEVPYPILLDVDLGAVRSLEIEGSLARPTAILVDKDGTVRYAYEGNRINDRPSIPALMSHLDEINS